MKKHYVKCVCGKKIDITVKIQDTQRKTYLKTYKSVAKLTKTFLNPVIKQLQNVVSGVADAPKILQRQYRKITRNKK